MSLPSFIGHDQVREQLATAIASDRLPQVLLVTGAAGVGKQRLGLWLAQTLLCTGAGPRPCGACRGCVQVLALTHPDLHWFVPVLRPKATDPEKQVDEVEEALEGVMAERRQNPLWHAPDGMAIHGISAARLLQRKASLTSVEGGWRIFIIGHAERLVPQDANPEGANALLKLLEEPPRRMLIVLTASEAGQLLPTIRSRATPVRLGRLSDGDVRSFLGANKPELARDDVVEQARGSIGTALASALGARARAAADAFLGAVRQGHVAAAERVLRQQPWDARGEFTALLDAVAEGLSERSRRALGPSGHVSPVDVPATLAGIGRVMDARERAQGNVNPQLLLAVLAGDLAELGAG